MSTAVLPDAKALSSPAAEARNRSDREHWRQEVISRVRQHRARRRSFDPHASLELDFPAEAALTISPPAEFVQPAQKIAPRDCETIRPQPRKIIRFPRQAAAPLDVEMAEPAPETPRILDAPEAEQMELLPSFADIRLEQSPQDSSLTEELDLPGCPAPLHQRLGSGVLDGLILLAALVVFAAPFMAVLSGLAEAAPRPRPALLCGLAVGAALWLLFQYLFLVHGRKTPGMSAAGLELLTFDGRRPSLFARCSRALAATLSGLSLGLGFFWALVDEHTLGWHDRISQTYLRSGDRAIR